MKKFRGGIPGKSEISKETGERNMIVTVIKGRKYTVTFGKDTVTFRYADTGKVKAVVPSEIKLGELLRQW